jgi:hypothetical protein
MDAGIEYHKLIEAVSNPERLSIIALLSMDMHYAAELAAKMNIDQNEIDDHLNILNQANLISRILDGNNEYLKFNPKTVEKIARQHLSKNPRTDEFATFNLEQEEKSIISHYLNRDGSLASIPNKSNKLRVVLAFTSQAFEFGPKYRESEVNDMLSRYYADTTTLRRLLIDYRFLDRDKDGSSYWRVQ